MRDLPLSGACDRCPIRDLPLSPLLNLHRGIALSAALLHTVRMEELRGLRLDIWLDVACVLKSRSQAQRACKLGRVQVNGQRGKASRVLHVGDSLEVSFPGGRKRILKVLGLADRHLPRAEARKLYEDLTPEPTPEEVELRRLLRLSSPAPRPRGAGAPKKKERREIRRVKEAFLDD